MNMEENSNLHLVLSSNSEDLCEVEERKVDYLLKDLFGQTFTKMARIDNSAEDVEIIYSIQKPVFTEHSIMKTFYFDLEILLEELREFNPHFTQLRGIDEK